MLKIIIGLFVAALLVTSVLNSNREDNLQAQRNTEQRVLLTQMEALHTPAVSRLVDDWRTAYPAPSDERLTELRILVERVKADPAGAAQYTTAADQKRVDSLPFESPFGKIKASPGL